VVATLCSCSRAREEFVNGQGQAERDLAAGEMKIAFAEGTNMPAFWEYTDLLQKRYNIGWVVFSLPADRSAAAAWARGYNEVATRRIEHEITVQALKQTMTDALELQSAGIKAR